MKVAFLATCGLLAATLLSPAASAQDKPRLTVLTYDSFVSDWGPGPAIKTAFEADCGCELRFIPGGDGAALLSRLRLEGARSEADVILGLDTNLTAAATETGLFAPHGVTEATDLPVEWADPTFLPYDWGWFAFIHDKTRTPEVPSSLEALAASDLKVVIQDPRSSTPGLGLLMWVKAAYGERSGEIWAALSDNILTVTPGWSESYDLFLKGEADAVLSYSTSPGYHILAEKDESKAAIPFTEGHYLQVEVAGMLAHAREPELARKFMAFILSEPFQAALPETNWMYPAKTPAAGLPASFETLYRPATSLLLTPEEALAARGPAVEEWRAALAK